MKKLYVLLFLVSAALLLSCNKKSSSNFPLLFPSNDNVIGAKIFQGTVGDLPGCAAETEGYLYYVTDPGAFYYCGDDSAYHAIDLTGPAGTAGESINWLGELAAAPESPAPELNDAYYDTLLGEARIYNGSGWDTMVADVTINWRGELATAPLSPSVNDMYYNTALGRTYLYTTGGWQVVSYNGADGADGVSISWLGSYGAAPSACDAGHLNNAYYDSTNDAAYICNGSSWSAMVYDGADADHRTSSATVAAGDYLELIHGLGTSNLNFVAQFTVDNVVYNYSDYARYFAPDMPNTLLTDSQIFEATAAYYNAATKLANGNVLIAFQSGGYGYFTIIKPMGSVVVARSSFTDAGCLASHIAVAPLHNGGALIAFRNESASNHAYFQIVEPEGTLYFTDGEVIETLASTYFSAATLTDGTVAVVYSLPGSSASRNVVIDPADGSIVAGPSTYFGGSTIASVAGLSGNQFLLAYNNNAMSQGAFVIKSNTLGTVAGPTVFHTSSATCISAASLGNDNFCIFYRNYNTTGASVAFYDSGANLIRDPDINIDSTYFTHNAARMLANGDVFFAYYNSDQNQGEAVIFNQYGYQLTEPIIYGSSLATDFASPVPLDNGNVFLSYFCSLYGRYSIFTREHLQLYIVNSNTVWLRNNTSEDLDLVLSVLE